MELLNAVRNNVMKEAKEENDPFMRVLLLENFKVANTMYNGEAQRKYGEVQSADLNLK